MSDYTPGPWAWEDDRGNLVLRSPDTLVASATYSDSDVEVEKPADARLIAAAPEMAEWIGRIAASRDPALLVLIREANALMARIRGEA